MAEQASDALEVPRIESWFAAHAGPVELPLAFEQIAGGRSNLTFAVSDAAGRRWALRRPPLGKRLASAHDMGREFRIISALADTAVPVAPTVGLAEDADEPFYVMHWVEGPVLRTLADAELFPDLGRAPTRSPSGWSTPWSRSTPSIPTRSVSASWPAGPTTSPASCAAGAVSGKSSTPASCP